MRFAASAAHAPSGLRLRRSATRTALRLLVPAGGDLFGRLIPRRSWRKPRRRNSPGGGMRHRVRKANRGNLGHVSFWYGLTQWATDGPPKTHNQINRNSSIETTRFAATTR